LSSSSGSDRTGREPDVRTERTIERTVERTIDERGIDRRLLARLIARHGAPQQTRLLTDDEAEQQQLVARRERAMAAADPTLLGRLARHEQRSGDLTWAQRSATAMSRKDLGHPCGLDLSANGLRELGEIREVEVSQDLLDAMEHRTPQAFLRDLHRPVQYFGDVTLRRAPSPTAASSLARVRAVVTDALSHRAGAAGSIELASRGAREGLAELRATLARPWEESRPANPLPMASRAPSAEDMQWFGLSGGYDPDQ
jgi:hypothetical protein